MAQLIRSVSDWSTNEIAYNIAVQRKDSLVSISAKFGGDWTENKLDAYNIRAQLENTGTFF